MKKYLIIFGIVIVAIAGAAVWLTAAPSIDPFLLPPDPGEAGKQTLEGIDSDSDGVRDDVQRYIATTYPQSARARAALSQYAIALQHVLLDTKDPTRAKAAWSDAIAGLRCLMYIQGVKPAASTETLIRAEYLNTEPRVRAFFEASRHSPPAPSTLDELSNPSPNYRSFCAFEPDRLPN